MFNALDMKSLEDICFMALKNVRNLLASKGVCVVLEKPAVRAIIADCYDECSGAETIDMHLGHTVVTTLSKMLIRGELTGGDTVKITVSDDVQNDLELNDDSGKRDLIYQIEHGSTSAKNKIQVDDPSNHRLICSSEDSNNSSEALPVKNFNVILSAADSVASSKPSLKRKQPALNARYETAKSCGEKRRDSCRGSFSQENQKKCYKPMSDNIRSGLFHNPSLSCLEHKSKTDRSVVSKSSNSVSVAEDAVTSEKRCGDHFMASIPSNATTEFPQSWVSSVTSSVAEVSKILSLEERKIWEASICQGKKNVMSPKQSIETSPLENRSEVGSFDFSKPLHAPSADKNSTHPLMIHKEGAGQPSRLSLGNYGMWLINSNEVNFPLSMVPVSHPFAHYSSIDTNERMENDSAMKAKQMPVANSLNYLALEAPHRIDGPEAMDCEISTITNSITTEKTEKSAASVAEDNASTSQSCRWCPAVFNKDGVSMNCYDAFTLFCDFHRYQDKDPKAKEKNPAKIWKAISNEEHEFWIERAKEKNSDIGASSPKANCVPKKPMSAFLFFSKEHRKFIMRKHSHMKFENISKAVSDMWVNATDEEKAPFLQEAQKDRERYAQEMEKWTSRWSALQEQREKVLNAESIEGNED